MEDPRGRRKQAFLTPSLYTGAWPSIPDVAATERPSLGRHLTAFSSGCSLSDTHKGAKIPVASRRLWGVSPPGQRTASVQSDRMQPLTKICRLASGTFRAATM